MAKYYQDQQDGHSRARRIRRDEPLYYIISPQHAALFHPEVFGGRGTMMWTVLGQDALTGGSPFGGIMAQMGFNTGYWIAGHMLNQEMGGHGEPRNFVPLTGTANNNHSTYEEQIKTMLGILQRKDSYDNPFWYGVYYKVQASRESFFWGDFDPDEPFCMAPSYITLNIQPVKVLKEDVLCQQEDRRRIYALSAAENAPFADRCLRVEIHNTAYDAGLSKEEETCVRNQAYSIFVKEPFPGERGFTPDTF